MKTRKKTLCLILVLAIALAIGVVVFAHAPEQQRRYSLGEGHKFDITNLDDIVTTLRNALKNRSPEIGISFTFKDNYMDDISSFVHELMEMAQEETGEPNEGDYLRYQLGGYKFSYRYEKCPAGYEYRINITPDYCSSFEQECRTTAKIREILNSLSLPDSAGEYEKIRAVHDYLIQNVNYDTVHKKNSYHKLKSTAYGALINQCAVCQGYAVSVYRLLSELGVKCRVITGEGKSEQGSEIHAWNIVGIDGVYYNLDVTWDDVKQTKDYFLKSDAEFAGHRRDEKFRTNDFCSNYPMSDRSFD